MTDLDCLEEVQTFLANQPDHITLFQALERMISSIGPATVEVHHSQISFGTKAQFAWLWYPPSEAKRPTNSIVLSFSVGRRLKNKRFFEIDEAYPGRFTHHVIIESEADLNKEVFTWICEAYTFSLIRTRTATAVSL
ncbi:hypothetical protein HHO41_00405 [Bacillus sp. DNRA2]|uniref:DUF5655 domain-containing protein n=1 Tax=Bacillus sp. DNRA2 TaxID=2723053 RepID=UPI00145D7345|nr:DUF5655 domain-containing protein [Bacillus sp. DNRA2]NMD68729.1 hypothetical protein [Bacillus sp. DNRA2]